MESETPTLSKTVNVGKQLTMFIKMGELWGWSKCGVNAINWSKCGVNAISIQGLSETKIDKVVNYHTAIDSSLIFFAFNKTSKLYKNYHPKQANIYNLIGRKKYKIGRIVPLLSILYSLTK